MSRHAGTFGRRSGLTLLEVVLSLVVTAILLGAMTSTLLVAGRSMQPGADGPDARLAETARLVESITEDLRLALGFIERGANAVEFTVPDRDGDELPERLRYAWSGSPDYELTRLYLPSEAELEPDPVVIAEDVRQFDLEYLLRTWGPPPPPPALESDETILHWHDEVPEPGSVRVLLVVDSAASPSVGEAARKSLLESWGHAVTLIGAVEPRSSFDAAIASADVAYVCETIDSFALADKLRTAAVPVVNEEVNSVDDLGLAGAFGFPDPAATLDVDVPSHYLTSALGIDRVTLFTGVQPVTTLDVDPATHAPGLEVLGGWSGVPALGVIESGGQLYGDGDPGIQRVLLVVADAASPDPLESWRRTMLESWGFEVELIDDSASQAAFDEAATRCDAAYICAGADPDDVGTKLTWLPIGVVSELVELTRDLGLTNGTGHVEDDEDLVVLDNTHYITALFDLDEYELFKSEVEMAGYPGNPGAAAVLGEVPDEEPALATLSPGDPLKGVGGIATGRRVFLPWGGADIAVDDLEDEGLTIMRRSVEWAAAPPPAGIESVLPEQTGYDFAQRHVATRASFPVDARVTSVVAYLDIGNDREMRFGVYTDEDGEPGRLLAQTAKAKLDEGTGWQELELDVERPLDLPAGDYWLALGMHQSVGYVFSHAGGQTRHADSGEDPKDGLMADWSGTYESNTRRLSIYARYTPVELAPARRVQLPWAATGFDVDALSDEGRTLMQRTVAWAADDEDPYAVTELTHKRWIAQYVLPPLPENALEWSMSRLYVSLRADGKIDGDVVFELQHADGALNPSGQVIATSSPVPESDLDFGGFRWFEVPLPAAEDLNPEYGVCLVVRASRKGAALLKRDEGGAFATPSTHFMTTTDSGASWSPPNDVDDLRFYMLGTYSTPGAPQWP